MKALRRSATLLVLALTLTLPVLAHAQGILKGAQTVRDITRAQQGAAELARALALTSNASRTGVRGITEFLVTDPTWESDNVAFLVKQAQSGTLDMAAPELQAHPLLVPLLEYLAKVPSIGHEGAEFANIGEAVSNATDRMSRCSGMPTCELVLSGLHDTLLGAMGTASDPQATIARAMLTARAARREGRFFKPDESGLLAEALALVRDGEPTPDVFVPLPRPYDKPYQVQIHVADPGEGHAKVTAINPQVIELGGIMPHVEHILRESPTMLPYRPVTPEAVSRLGILTGGELNMSVFFGVPVINGSFKADPHSAVQSAAIAASLYFQHGASEVKFIMDGLTTSDATEFMRQVAVETNKKPAQVLAASFNITKPLVVDQQSIIKDFELPVVEGDVAIVRDRGTIKAILGEYGERLGYDTEFVKGVQQTQVRPPDNMVLIRGGDGKVYSFGVEPKGNQGIRFNDLLQKFGLEIESEPIAVVADPTKSAEIATKLVAEATSAINSGEVRGFGKVAWDGATDQRPSVPINERISWEEMVRLNRLAHEQGLFTYASAGMNPASMPWAGRAGLDGVGVGNSLHVGGGRDGFVGDLIVNKVTELQKARNAAQDSDVIVKGSKKIQELAWLTFEGRLQDEELKGMYEELYNAVREDNGDRVELILKKIEEKGY